MSTSSASISASWTWGCSPVDLADSLTGNASVKHVNLRPDKANELISRSPIPFSLKAGMLGKLSLKVGRQR